MTVPALLCIDVEPDERLVPVPPRPSWPGFERFAASVDDLRAELESASSAPARFSWFLRLDPQIEHAHGSPGWVVDRYGGTLAKLSSDGDELGVHAHCWRWAGDDWCNDHGDPAWVSHCVSSALAVFEASFGHRARAYRGGDRFIDATVLDVIERAGVEVDLTLEPGAPETRALVTSERSTGAIPGVPRRLQSPFVPCGSNPFAAGPLRRDRILMVPLFAAVGFSTAGGPYEPLLLWTPPRAFRALLLQRLRDPGLTHLAFAVRSDLGSDPPLWRWFRENLSFVATHFGPGIRWMTPTQAREVLQALPASAPTGDTIATEDLVAAASSLQAAIADADLGEFALADRVRRLESELESERRRAADDRASFEATTSELADAVRRLEADVATRAARAASLHQGLHDVSTELHRIQPYVGLADDLQRELATVRATRWWRLHDTLQPFLRAAARIGRPGRRSVR